MVAELATIFVASASMFEAPVGLIKEQNVHSEPASQRLGTLVDLHRFKKNLLPTKFPCSSWRQALRCLQPDQKRASPAELNRYFTSQTS